MVSLCTFQAWLRNAQSEDQPGERVSVISTDVLPCRPCYLQHDDATAYTDNRDKEIDAEILLCRQKSQLVEKCAEQCGCYGLGIGADRDLQSSQPFEKVVPKKHHTDAGDGDKPQKSKPSFG